MEFQVVDEYVAEGDRVCALIRTSWTNKTTGKIIETPKVDFWRFGGDKAIAFYEYYDTAAIFEGATP